MEVGERKQIYKQMHNVRKQPKPAHSDIGVGGKKKICKLGLNRVQFHSGVPVDINSTLQLQGRAFITKCNSDVPEAEYQPKADL